MEAAASESIKEGRMWRRETVASGQGNNVGVWAAAQDPVFSLYKPYFSLVFHKIRYSFCDFFVGHDYI